MLDYDSDIEPSELHALAVKSAKARGVDVDNWDAIRDDFDKGWEAFLQMYFAVRYFARYHSDLGYLDDEPTCQWWLIAKLNDDLLAQSMILFDSADEMRCTMEGMHENPVKYIEEHYKATDGKGNATIEVNGKPRKAGGKRKAKSRYAGRSPIFNPAGTKYIKVLSDGRTLETRAGTKYKLPPAAMPYIDELLNTFHNGDGYAYIGDRSWQAKLGKGDGAKLLPSKRGAKQDLWIEYEPKGLTRKTVKGRARLCAL